MRLLATADRKTIVHGRDHSGELLDFIERFESTNILMAADHLNHHGPLCQVGHEYIIRLKFQDDGMEDHQPRSNLHPETKDSHEGITNSIR